MNQALTQITIYAFNDEDELNEFSMWLGLPEKVDDSSSYRVALGLRKNRVERPDKFAFGVDSWQALTLAYTLLKVLLKLEFRNETQVFYYTREDALERRETHRTALGRLFPQDM